MKKKIHYYDTDCGGIVYYGNYLKYLEEARTEVFEDLGFTIKALADKGVMFVVARQELDYKLPASYGDVIEATAKIIEIKRSSIVFDCHVKNHNGQTLCSGKTVMVCVNTNIRPQQIPADIKQKFVATMSK